MGSHDMHNMNGGMHDMNTTIVPMNHSSSMHMHPTTTAMNHAGHDMGGDGVGGMHGMGMMKMYFHTDYQMTYVLFEQCMLMKDWQLAVACIILAIIAALYEGLKVFREHLLIVYAAGENKYIVRENDRSASPDMNMSSSSSKVEIVTAGPQGSVRTRMCSWLHVSQTTLHMLQITISYLLMLVVMTYNLYLCLSVVLGAGLGYFLFGWKRAIVNDRNEHCH